MLLVCDFLNIHVSAELRLAQNDGGHRICVCADCASDLQANVHLLATCYYRSNQVYRAYHLLTGKHLEACAVPCGLHAVCSHA